MSIVDIGMVGRAEDIVSSDSVGRSSQIRGS